MEGRHLSGRKLHRASAFCCQNLVSVSQDRGLMLKENNE